MDRRIIRSTAVVLLSILLASCSTTIIGDLTTTSSTTTTTTTVPVPEGDVDSLVAMLAEVPVGLGQAVVDRDTDLMLHKVALADAIWTALRPKAEAVDPDWAASIGRVVNLIHTAVERKRPADADKALRFVTLLADAG